MSAYCEATISPEAVTSDCSDAARSTTAVVTSAALSSPRVDPRHRATTATTATADHPMPAGHHRHVEFAAQQRRKRRLPIAENALHVAIDHPRAEPGRARKILHVIDHTRATVERLEPVLVTPPAIRTGDLSIDKPHSGFPHVNACAPGDRHAVQLDHVVDQRAFFHLDWQRRGDAETQPRRRQALEVLRVREECEGLVEISRRPWPRDAGSARRDRAVGRRHATRSRVAGTQGAWFSHKAWNSSRLSICRARLPIAERSAAACAPPAQISTCGGTRESARRSF